MRLPRRPHMPGYQKSAPGSGPAGPGNFGYFPSQESSPPAGGISPGHRFRTCTSGPVWDRPLRRGIKPERRADNIRPYGITVARHPAGAQCAPLRKDRIPGRWAHNVRPHRRTGKPIRAAGRRDSARAERNKETACGGLLVSLRYAAVRFNAPPGSSSGPAPPDARFPPACARRWPPARRR